MTSPALSPIGPSTTAPFTPSELVYLRGAEFAKKAILGNTTLLTDEKVDATGLGVEMLVAAALAAEASGAITLARAGRKAVIGLLTRKVVEVRAGAGPVAWPPGTIEHAIAASARVPPATLQEIARDLLERDSGDPWDDLMTRVKSALADRGLVGSETRKVLRLLPVRSFTLPEATRAQAAAADIAPVRALVADAAARDADLLALLRKEAKAGVESRREASDGPD